MKMGDKLSNKETIGDHHGHNYHGLGNCLVLPVGEERIVVMEYPPT